MALVTVGCKLPCGLIIDLANDQSIVLNGSNASDIIGGYGLTYHVDKDLFEAWLIEHKDYEPVKQGLIFMQEKEGSARAEAKEKASLKSGFEGIDPAKPGPGIKSGVV